MHKQTEAQYPKILRGKSSWRETWFISGLGHVAPSGAYSLSRNPLMLWHLAQEGPGPSGLPGVTFDSSHSQ